MSCFIVSVGGYYGEDIIDIVVVVIVFLHPCEPLLVLEGIMERIGVTRNPDGACDDQATTAYGNPNQNTSIIIFKIIIISPHKHEHHNTTTTIK